MDSNLIKGFEDVKRAVSPQSVLVMETASSHHCTPLIRHLPDASVWVTAHNTLFPQVSRLTICWLLLMSLDQVGKEKDEVRHCKKDLRARTWAPAAAGLRLLKIKCSLTQDWLNHSAGLTPAWQAATFTVRALTGEG